MVIVSNIEGVAMDGDRAATRATLLLVSLFLVLLAPSCGGSKPAVESAITSVPLPTSTQTPSPTPPPTSPIPLASATSRQILIPISVPAAAESLIFLVETMPNASIGEAHRYSFSSPTPETRRQVPGARHSLYELRTTLGQAPAVL